MSRQRTRFNVADGGVLFGEALAFGSPSHDEMKESRAARYLPPRRERNLAFE